MAEPRGEIVVGILGQWASGKSTAAKTLISYLGGENEVVFIADRELLAGLAVNHILELEDSKVRHFIEEDGRQLVAGELSIVYLEAGEDLESVDLNTLRFDLHDDVYKEFDEGESNWLKRARVDLGNQICKRSAEGKPIVIEAGFGTNTESTGKNPFSHTISDLFTCLTEAGVESKQVKWIIVEAGYEKRSERNSSRLDSVPAAEFDRFAADGGDLDPDHQKSLEEKGIVIKRVPNNHDDVQRFKADIIAAFQELFGRMLDVGTVEDRQGQD